MSETLVYSTPPKPLAKSLLRPDYREADPLSRLSAIRSVLGRDKRWSLFVVGEMNRLGHVYQRDDSAEWSFEDCGLELAAATDSRPRVPFDVAVQRDGAIVLVASGADGKLYLKSEGRFTSWRELRDSSIDESFRPYGVWLSRHPANDTLACYCAYSTPSHSSYRFGYWSNLDTNAPKFTAVSCPSDGVEAAMGMFAGRAAMFEHDFATRAIRARTFEQPDVVHSLGSMATRNSAFGQVCEKYAPEDTATPFLLAEVVDSAAAMWSAKYLRVYRQTAAGTLAQTIASNVPNTYFCLGSGTSITYRGTDNIGLEVFGIRYRCNSKTSIVESSELVCYSENLDTHAYSATTVQLDAAIVPISGGRQTFTGPFAFGHGATGEATLFVCTKGGSLMQLWRDAIGDWHRREVLVKRSGEARAVQSWVTEVTMLGEDNIIQPNRAVRLSATSPTRLVVNHREVLIDEAGYVCATDELGKILLSDAAGSLWTLPIRLYRTPQDSGNLYYEIDPSGEIHEVLKTLTPKDMEKVKIPTADGRGTEDLLSKPVDPDTLRVVADAVNTAAKLAVRETAGVASRANLHHHSDAGFRAIAVDPMSPPSVSDRRIHVAAVPDQAWAMKFDNTNFAFNHLLSSSAQDIFSQALAAEASYARERGIPTLADAWSWGDLWTNITNGIASAVTLVVDKLGDSIKVLVKCVVEGVERAWHGVMNWMEQVFDVIGNVFKTIGVALEKAWRWLGFMFAWDDILVTSEAISYQFEQGLEAANTLLLKMSEPFQKKAKELKKDIQDGFGSLIAKFGGSLSDTSRQNPQPDERFAKAQSANAVMQGLQGNAKTTLRHGAVRVFGEYRVEGQPPSTSAEVRGIVDSLLQIASQIETHDEFSKVGDYIDDAVRNSKDVSSFLGKALAALLQLLSALAQTGVDFAAQTYDVLTKGAASAIAALKNAITAKIEIPFVSDFYREHISKGQDLTILSISSIIAAIPATLVYKFMYDKAPLTRTGTGEGSLQEFKTSTSAQALLQHIPTLREADADGSAPRVDISTTARILCGIIAMVALIVSACIRSASDFLKFTGPGAEGEAWSFPDIMEAFLDVASWITALVANVVDDWNVYDIISAAVAALIVIMDIGFIAATHENSSYTDPGAVLYFMLSAVGLACFLKNAIERWSGAALAMTISYVPGIFAAFRYPAFAAAVRGKPSGIVCAAILSALNLLGYISFGVATIMYEPQFGFVHDRERDRWSLETLVTNGHRAVTT